MIIFFPFRYLNKLLCFQKCKLTPVLLAVGIRESSAVLQVSPFSGGFLLHAALSSAAFSRWQAGGRYRGLGWKLDPGAVSSAFQIKQGVTSSFRVLIWLGRRGASVCRQRSVCGGDWFVLTELSDAVGQAAGWALKARGSSGCSLPHLHCQRASSVIQAKWISAYTWMPVFFLSSVVFFPLSKFFLWSSLQTKTTHVSVLSR